MQCIWKYNCNIFNFANKWSLLHAIICPNQDFTIRIVTLLHVNTAIGCLLDSSNPFQLLFYEVFDIYCTPPVEIKLKLNSKKVLSLLSSRPVSTCAILISARCPVFCTIFKIIGRCLCSFNCL
jgi:hypothetical protein